MNFAVIKTFINIFLITFNGFFITLLIRPLQHLRKLFGQPFNVRSVVCLFNVLIRVF